MPEVMPPEKIKDFLAGTQKRLFEQSEQDFIEFTKGRGQEAVQSEIVGEEVPPAIEDVLAKLDRLHEKIGKGERPLKPEPIPTKAPEKEVSTDAEYEAAVSVVRKTGSPSISMLQRTYGIGFNKAAKLIQRMEADGIVSPATATEPRKIVDWTAPPSVPEPAVSAAENKSILSQAEPQTPLVKKERLPDVDRGVAPEPTPHLGEPSAGQRAVEVGLEQLKRNVDETRGKYIDEYREFIRSKKERIGFLRRLLGTKTKEEELPNTLKEAKRQYDAAKSEYAKRLYEERTNRQTLYEELFINEYRILQHTQTEVHPPRERSIAGKLFGQWNNLPRELRWGISAALATGFAVGGGTAVLGTSALMFAGIRYGRAVLTTIATPAAAEGFGLLIKRFESKEKTREYRESKFFEEIGKLNWINHLEAKSEEYQKIIDETAKRERRQNLAKWVLASVVVGGGTMFFGGMIDHALGFGKPTVPLDKAGRPSGLTFEKAQELVKQKQILRNQLEAEGKPWEELARQESFETQLQTEGEPWSEFAKAEAASRAVSGAVPASGVNERLLELATINEGEGVWNPVYRQLEDQLDKDPNGFAARYGWDFKDSALNDPATIKDILNRQTQELLVQNKIIQDGVEIRIAKPGVHVLLGEDNTIKIEGGDRFTYESPRPKVEGPPVADIKSPDMWPQGGVAPDWAAQAEPGEIKAPPAPEIELKEITLEHQGGGLKENVLQEYGERPSAPIDYETGQTANKGALGENIRRYTLDLPHEKISLLDDLVYNNPTAGAGVNELADYIKKGKLTVRDFAHYYISEESRGEKTAITKKFLKNLEDSFRLVSEGGAEEKKQAAGAIRMLLNSLRQGRPTL